jgi:hypothetical protein
VKDWRHIFVWEVSTVAIPGQELLERCEWDSGDVHPEESKVAKSKAFVCEFAEGSHQINRNSYGGWGLIDTNRSN